MGILTDTRVMKVESVYAQPEEPHHPIRYDIRLAPVETEDNPLTDANLPVRITQWGGAAPELPQVGEEVKVSAWNHQWKNVSKEGGAQVVHLRGLKHLKAA